MTSGNATCFERTPTGLLIDIRTPTGTYNPLYDAQGDIIALVNSSGKVERNFRYGPYGENTKSEGTQTIPYPFGYKGGYRTPGGNKGEGNVENGLYHYGQRYYDPTTGRWTQQDPLSHLTSATQGDRFLYAGGDPINFSDSTGLYSATDYAKACGAGAFVGVFVGGPVGGCATGAAGLFVTEGAEAGVEDVEYLVEELLIGQDGGEEARRLWAALS